jgi:hypothetical protein
MGDSELQKMNPVVINNEEVLMDKEPVIESSGNVFADLGFSPEETALLAMRVELMAVCAKRLLNATGRNYKQPSIRHWAIAHI